MPDRDAPTLALIATGGMGATEVLERAAVSWERAGTEVVRVTGRRSDTDHPLAALQHLLGDECTDARSAQQSLLHQLRDRTAVLVVDAAQWLDPATIEVLTAVAEHSRACRAPVVVAHRPVRHRPDIAALDCALAAHEPVLWLEPLDAADVEARVAAATGVHPSRELVGALVDLSDGVARYVDVLVAACDTPEAIVDGLFGSSPRPLPRAVVARVDAEVSVLEQPAQRVLMARQVEPMLDAASLRRVADVTDAQLEAADHALWSAGLTRPHGRGLVPVVAAALDQIVPEAERHALHGLVADALEASGAPLVLVAEHLVASRRTGAGVAAQLVAAADEGRDRNVDAARDWYAHAISVGADATALAARRAEVAALAGDVAGAVAVAEEVLPDRGATDWQRAALVAAATLPALGRWAASARRYADLATASEGSGAVALLLAAVGHVAAGDERAAAHALDAATATASGAPCLFESAIAALGQACHASVEPRPTRAVGCFLEAADLVEAIGDVALLLPDTPHALGTVAALAGFDHALALHLAQRAVAVDAGGPAFTARHRLLLGRIGLRTGSWAVSRSALDGVGDWWDSCTPRDALLAAALDVGLARRAADLQRLLTVWPAARDVVYRHPADLYALDAFGEIAAAAARVGDVDVARARLGELADVVDRLGTPPLWATPLSWARVEMAVANDDAAALGQEAAFLGSLDSTAVPRAGALGTAARAWSATAAGKVDAVTTEHGIASLLSLGMRWDAARLAGAAAARCDDAALARALLERARQLKVPVGQDAVVPVAVDGLSQREREVASLLVAGLTHKEIGAQLFISAKTVEHHAARIRQRLGAATRAELLAVLADAEAAAEPPADAGDALHSAGL